MAAHSFEFPGHPTRLNELLGNCWRAARLKKRDRLLVGLTSRAVPRAGGARRVSLVLTLAPGQRGGDPDAYWKSTLDALVYHGLLLDDNRQNVELGPVRYERGGRRGTTITLEDLG